MSKAKIIPFLFIVFLACSQKAKEDSPAAGDDGGEAAITEARLVAAAFADPAHAGFNVINIDGRMIERLHAEEAARLLDKVATIAARKDKP